MTHYNIFLSAMHFLHNTVKPIYNDHLYNLLPVIDSVMCFNEDWRYQFTFANNLCILEFI